ncbi:cell division protein FtsQ/DivIB [Lacticaseibacillus camelliae]|uniref:Cell division protein DivIB n=1 Tax=Lacticaseibacillus camelliae DSM 22697 = JCM 13995 TaxID=1423730 RepID=A0A0R2FBR8_9LACO|nr:cell division protein FtsQ/DivIB [Lacticaseibacillus camelliae]KRN25582.1 cell division septal protein [Lacticaseibacillus camelliae DSM 22697 = JCM 13995]
MAWRKHAKPNDPLTPWEAYQAKQKRRPERATKLHLPGVATLRRRKRTRNLVLLLTPLLLLLAFFGYMVSPLAKVQQVSVAGTVNVPIQTVIDASGLSDRVLIPQVVVSKHKLAARIEKRVPQIKTARVSVSALDHVTIHVAEHQPIGYVVTKKRYHMILANGTIIKSGTTTPLDNYPVFTGFSAGEAGKLAQTLSRFPAVVRRTTSEVTASRGEGNPYQITMTMTDGNTVVADSRTVAKQIKYYPSIIAQVKGKGTVDLEVGAYFKPYSKSTSK